jgi:hypothetical protein
MEKLSQAQFQHLNSLFENHAIALPQNTGALSLRWLGSWEKINQGETLDDWEIKCAVEVFRGGMEFDFFTIEKNASPDEIEKLHQSVVAKMMKGDFRDREIETCANTGEKVSVQFKNWQPLLGQRDFSKGIQYSEFLPLDWSKFTPLAIEQVVLPVPSGKLWCADWFRIDEFTELNQELQKTSTLSFNLNSLQGRINTTHEFLKWFGGIHLCVGNSSPSLFQENNIWMLANLDEENTPFNRASALREYPEICTDLWWVTMVDPQVFEAKLQEHWPDHPERVKRVMAALNESDSVVKIDLNPRDYHIYFAGDEEVLRKNWDMEEWEMVPNALTYMVMSEHELTPKAQPNVSPSKKARFR